MKNIGRLIKYLNERKWEHQNAIRDNVKRLRDADPIIKNGVRSHAITGTFAVVFKEIYSQDAEVEIPKEAYLSIPGFREYQARVKYYGKLMNKKEAQLEHLKKQFELDLLLADNGDAKELLEKVLLSIQELIRAD